MILNEAADEHGLYPIRTVSQLTGVNPVTLRAWERRYGLVRPVRTEKGHRLYSKRDIEEIRRILRLLEQGMTIGKVSPVLEVLTPDVSASSGAPSKMVVVTPGDAWVEAYGEALARLDEMRLDVLESEALVFAHPDALLERHLLPLLDDMADARLHDAVIDARYRLMQTRLTRQLAQRAGACVVPADAARVLVASLPPERGLFPLWRLVWSLRRAGIHARLLGSGAPVLTLMQALRTLPAQVLVLAFDHKPPVAVVGAQLPMLMGAGYRVLALGPHAHALRIELEAMGILVQPSADVSAADFIRAAL